MFFYLFNFRTGADPRPSPSHGLLLWVRAAEAVKAPRRGRDHPVEILSDNSISSRPTRARVLAGVGGRAELGGRRRAPGSALRRRYFFRGRRSKPASVRQLRPVGAAAPQPPLTGDANEVGVRRCRGDSRKRVLIFVILASSRRELASALRPYLCLSFAGVVAVICDSLCKPGLAGLLRPVPLSRSYPVITPGRCYVSFIFR